MDAISSILTIVGILVTLVIVAGSIYGARKMVSGMLSPLLAQQAENKRLMSVGVPCLARVLHIEQTGTSVAIMGEQSYEIRFHLEITPPAAAYRGGAGPYRAEMVSLVPMLSLPRIQPGSQITVRVDPHDPRKMAFDSANPPGAAQYPGAAMFAPVQAGYPGAAPTPGYGAPTPGYGAPADGRHAAYGAPPAAWPQSSPQGVYGQPYPGYPQQGPGKPHR